MTQSQCIEGGDPDVVDVHARCAEEIRELQSLAYSAWQEIHLMPGAYQQGLAARLFKASGFGQEDRDA